MSIQAKQSLVGDISTVKTEVTGVINNKTNLTGFVIEKEKLFVGTVASKEFICGDINTKTDLIGCVSGHEKLEGQVAIGDSFEYVNYAGPYEIMPKTEHQVANTKGRLMKDDFTIYAIPYAEVSNSANGITVTIGG